MTGSNIKTQKANIRAPHGTSLSCKGWQQEAALRMLMNSLDPDVSERPAAQNWNDVDATIAALQGLENDETLLVQAGKPVGIFRTNENAPRVLNVNGNLSGSWTYIGTQGILQTTYELFSAVAQQHFGGDLAGKLVVSGGLGGLSGAQPLAVTLNGGAFLGIDVDPERIKRRVKSGYCDVMVNDLDESLRILKNAVRKREPAAVGLVGNCADLIPALAKRGLLPDLLTDQTSAHDPLNGYIPQGVSIGEADELRQRDPVEYRRRAIDSIAAHVRGMLDLQKLGAVTFDSGNNIRALAFEHGVKDAFDIPSIPPAYIRPLFSEGRIPLSWVSLSGEPSDIHRTDQLLLEMFPQNEMVTHWIRTAQKKVRFQGLPARACWLGYQEAAKFGIALNGLVARGEVKAPVVICRDGLNAGATMSPHGKYGSMFDASDSVTDTEWTLLNAMLNTASGASWVSIQNGMGPRIDHSLHGSLAIVVDGTPEMGARRIERVLENDSGNRVARQVDAGNSEAMDYSRRSGIKIP